LICGGRMVVVTQPVRGPVPLEYFRQIDRLLGDGDGFTEAVVVDPDQAGGGLSVGRRFLFDGEGRPMASLPFGNVSERFSCPIAKPAARPKPSVQNGIAFLPSWPRIRLIVVGAGHVGQAVALLAAQADFDVWVVDDRRQYASSERFPTAKRILVGTFGEVLKSLEITPLTYALIVTRGHGHDQEALEQLASSSAEYVGLIGSRRKIRLIFDNLLEAGVPESDLARVTAPVGLDIGSQTVPEIAISIVAELIARRNVGLRRAAVSHKLDASGRAQAGSRQDAGPACST
jgi:xanthine dehydrogenase accessory factor